MSNLKVCVQVATYVTIAATLVSIGVLAQKLGKEYQSLAGLRNPIQTKRKQLRANVGADITESAERLTGHNVTVSLSTSAASYHSWRTISSIDQSMKRARLVSCNECVSNAWQGCSNPTSGLRWIVPEAGRATDAIFVVMFILAVDDLVTIAGTYRVNGTHMFVLHNEVRPGKWAESIDALRNANVVAEDDDPDGASAINPRDMKHSLSLMAGSHIIGFQIEVSETRDSPPPPALWFSGTLSGTIANNIALL